MKQPASQTRVRNLVIGVGVLVFIGVLYYLLQSSAASLENFERNGVLVVLLLAVFVVVTMRTFKSQARSSKQQRFPSPLSRKNITAHSVIALAVLLIVAVTQWRNLSTSALAILFALALAVIALWYRDWKRAKP